MAFPSSNKIGGARPRVKQPVAPPSPVVKKVKPKSSTKLFSINEVEDVDDDGVITHKPSKAKPVLSKRAKALAVVPQAPVSPKVLKQQIAALTTDNVPKDTAKILQSRFGPKAEMIVQQLETGEADGSVTVISRSLLQMLVDILPIAENAVRASNARYGVYQLIQITSQIRESLNDLQAVRDRGLLGHNVVDRIIRPSYQDLAAQIVVAFINLEASARTRMDKDDFKTFQADVLQTRTGLATYLTRQYDEIQKSVIESLS